MADRVVGFRLADELIEALDLYATATVRNRTQVIEVAVRAFLASPDVVETVRAEREKNAAVTGG